MPHASDQERARALAAALRAHRDDPPPGDGSRVWCDFCSTPTPVAFSFPAAAFVRVVLLLPPRARGQAPEVVVAPCDCHFEAALAARRPQALEVVTEPFTGDWLACPPCADCVTRGDRDGLLARALAAEDESTRAVSVESPDLARASVTAAHLGYWLHLTPAPEEA